MRSDASWRHAIVQLRRTGDADFATTITVRTRFAPTAQDSRASGSSRESEIDKAEVEERVLQPGIPHAAKRR